MSYTSEAKSVIKRFKSLNKVANSLGYVISDDISEDDEYSYVIFPKKYAKVAGIMSSILEASGYHKRYPLVFLRSEEEIISVLSVLAIAAGKNLDREKDRWFLNSLEEFSQKDKKEYKIENS